ncbi:cuticle protein 38 [Manduca sexta]|uniref:Cuticle protein n=1 Tax=Manduca sexta TaxID=7130 RepID=A0A922CEC6_MANSE|nr:cuticle protein 38 [Manduca sexta]KAG6442263.1 hypothetical protein O3G_MSEX002194 [Manduca sexta]
MMKLVVLSCLMAAASASGIIAPYASLVYSAPLVAAPNYRGPLSLAPGQPANVLGADGRPLDTLDVNLDRAAHYTAKALEPFHLLKKRSAAFVAPIAPLVYSAPLVAAHNYRGPLSLAPGQPANILGADGRPLDTLEVNLDRSAHYASKAFSVHLLKKRSAPVIAPISTYALAHAPVVAHAAPIAYSAPLAAAHYAPLAYAAAPLAHWYK